MEASRRAPSRLDSAGALGRAHPPRRDRFRCVGARPSHRRRERGEHVSRKIGGEDPRDRRAHGARSVAAAGSLYRPGPQPTLSLGAAAAALAAASWGVPLLLQRLATPPGVRAVVDRNVLLFSLAIAAATGLAFGLAPATAAARRNLAAFFQARQGELPSQTRLQRFLVVGQVSLSLLLLSMAGLFLRSLEKASSVDIGLDRAAAHESFPSPSTSRRRTTRPPPRTGSIASFSAGTSRFRASPRPRSPKFCRSPGGRSETRSFPPTSRRRRRPLRSESREARAS